MRFVYPWLLLLLPAIPLLGLLWLWIARQSRQSLGRLVSPALQPRLMPLQSQALFVVQVVLALTGLTLLIIAAARPQWGHATEHVVSRGRNLVIALDVSRSMLTRDVHPNRLERAKVDIMDLITELKGDRAALLAFRKRGALLCPLTTDYAFLRQTLDGVSINSAPRGETDIGDGIRKSLDALDAAQDDYNAIILISDGGDLTGDAIAAARDAAKRGVPIFTVGIGGDADAPIPDDTGAKSLLFEGKPIQTRLEEGTLETIARESGGRYVSFGTAGTAQTTLGSIFRQHLRQVAAREQEERLERRCIERYQTFLFPALTLLLAAAYLSRGRFSSQTKRKRTQTSPTPPPLPVQILLICLFAGMTARAETNDSTNAPTVPPGRAGARQAQSLYNQRKYADAATAYASAARGADTEEAQRYLFNAACADHRAGNETAAIALLPSLLHSHEAGDRAAELLGLSAFTLASGTNRDCSARLDAIEEAGSAFQQALRNHPDESRRKENLARIQNQLPSLRDDAHIAQVLKEHGQTPPDQILTTMLHEQRMIGIESQEALTNNAPGLIRNLETLADRQDHNTDLWIPLKQAILQSPGLTNMQQRAEFERSVELTRDAMTSAAEKMRDIDPAYSTALSHVEPAIYHFWRGIVPPPPLVDEDIDLQSNAIFRADQPRVPNRPDQPEALELTRLFQQRFPAWADQMAQAAKSDTNAPSFKPEDRAEIERLTSETLALQQAVSSAQSAHSLQDQHHALRDLLRIRELLPKQKNKNQQQQQNKQQQQQKDQSQPQQQPPPEQKDSQKEEQKEQPKPQPQPPKNVEDLLQRALQREKEHETKKLEQLKSAPMLPDERDW